VLALFLLASTETIVENIMETAAFYKLYLPLLVPFKRPWRFMQYEAIAKEIEPGEMGCPWHIRDWYILRSHGTESFALSL
jgi:hypothetical protein